MSKHPEPEWTSGNMPTGIFQMAMAEHLSLKISTKLSLKVKEGEK